MEKQEPYDPVFPERSWGYKLLHWEAPTRDFDDPIYDLDWGYKREVVDMWLERREHCNDYPNCIKNCRACLYTNLYQIPKN